MLHMMEEGWEALMRNDLEIPVHCGRGRHALGWGGSMEQKSLSSSRHCLIA